jgi:hypothetical protein
MRLFPHGDRFDNSEDLADFLVGELKEQNGVYRVIKASKYSGLRVDDLVIFHKNDRFVGEARIQKKLRRYGRPKVVDDYRYEGEIVFDPASIRIFPPTFDEVASLSDLRVFRPAVQRISIKDYQAIRGIR